MIFFGEVGLGERHDDVRVRFRTAHHPLPPPIPNHALAFVIVGVMAFSNP